MTTITAYRLTVPASHVSLDPYPRAAPVALSVPDGWHIDRMLVAGHVRTMLIDDVGGWWTASEALALGHATIVEPGETAPA